MEIRRAVLGDADQVFGLAVQLATSAVPERVAFAVSYEEILADPRQLLIVADSGDAVVGYLYGLVHPALHANGPIGWVEELIVDRDRRSSGLGRSLMIDFERWAFGDQHARYVALASRRAGDFYRRIGYQESATYFKTTQPIES